MTRVGVLAHPHKTLGGGLDALRTTLADRGIGDPVWRETSGDDTPRLVAELVDAVGRPERLAVFGTGETQWGEEYYCGAVRRMAAFFDTRYPRLEIEQMPHGERDATKVRRWTDHILNCTETLVDADPARFVA